MVDDNPQDLVHDLAAEAVLIAPARAAGDRSGRDLGVSPRTLRAYHGGAYVGPNVVLSASGHVSHDRLVELFAARRGKASNGDSRLRRSLLARQRRPGYRFLRRRTEQYRRPRRPRIARDDDRRYAVLHCSTRSSAGRRRQGFPGDPREARHGLQRLHVRVALRRDRPGLRRHPRGQPRGMPRRDRRRAVRRGGREPPPGRARCGKENLEGRLLLSLEERRTG